MSVNKYLVIMYGWKSDKAYTHPPKNENGDIDYDNGYLCGNWKEDSEGNIDYWENPTLFFCEDDMCGNYEYFGIPLVYSDVKWDNPEFHLDDIKVDTLWCELHSLITDNCQYLIDDGSYNDYIVELDGKKPQLHIFIHAS